MKIKELGLHPRFPYTVWVVVEQPRSEPDRMVYDPLTETFLRSAHQSLAYQRGFPSAYGWIGGVICGVFFRNDGDHKFVAIDEAWAARLSQADLACLDADTLAGLHRLYPRIGENEGWFGAEPARSYLLTHSPEHI